VFFAEGLPGGLEGVAGPGVKEDEVNGFERGFAFQVLEGFSQHDLGAFIHGEAGNASAYGRKSDGRKIALGGEAEGVGGGSAQSFRGGGHSAEAHAGGVDNVTGFELAATGDGGIADGDAADFVALSLDGFAAFAGYSAGYACAEDEVVVGGVDDGVDVHFGYVALLDLDAVDRGSHRDSLEHLDWLGMGDR
jgi:hypothetical protein